MAGVATLSLAIKKSRGDREVAAALLFEAIPNKGTEKSSPLAFTHFAERRANALLGQSSESNLLLLLAFQPLHCNQKPGGCWLAI